MIKKVLFYIYLYLVAMLLYYGVSHLFEPIAQENKKMRSAYLSVESIVEESPELQQEKVVAQTEDIDLHIRQVKHNIQGNPFSIEVNIVNQIEMIENETPHKSSYFMADIPRLNVLEEVEKRKCKIKYKRIFCLCFIKQKLKRLTAQKMAITNKKGVNVDG